MKYIKTRCTDCNKNIGYKQNDSKPKRCQPCRSKIPQLNPMFGKCHPDRAKFRKQTFSNVDYNDRIVEHSPAGNPRKKYRMKCKQCNADRGYQTHKDALRLCKQCRDDSVRCYTPAQRRIRYAMKANLVARLKQRLLSKEGKSTFDVLPYTVKQLIEHLESRFRDGMTWDNYGEWQIDHITPDSWFVYNSTDDQGFKDSWSLDNLQPLWREDNLAKSNHYKG